MRVKYIISKIPCRPDQSAKVRFSAFFNIDFDLQGMVTPSFLIIGAVCEKSLKIRHSDDLPG